MACVQRSVGSWVIISVIKSLRKIKTKKIILDVISLKEKSSYVESDIKNDIETIEIYKSIMESDDISSSIKERVNKIHEFQIYK